MNSNSTTVGRLGRPGLTRMTARLWGWVASCRRRSRQRAQLVTLDERALKDIGATRLEARREWRKPFWVP